MLRSQYHESVHRNLDLVRLYLMTRGDDPTLVTDRGAVAIALAHLADGLENFKIYPGDLPMDAAPKRGRPMVKGSGRHNNTKTLAVGLYYRRENEIIRVCLRLGLDPLDYLGEATRMAIFEETRRSPVRTGYTITKPPEETYHLERKKHGLETS